MSHRQTDALRDPALYVNRELSWLEFNHRVLEEAQDPSNPLLERVKFLSIVSSNLDEFFMVRVAGLHRAIDEGDSKPDVAGLTPREQLRAVAARTHRMVADQYACWNDDLVPALKEQGIQLPPADEWTQRERVFIEQHFDDQLYPQLTPMAIDFSHPFPQVANLTLNLAVRLAPRDEDESLRLAIVPLPSLEKRLVALPAAEGRRLVMLEDVVRRHIETLFTGQEILEVAVFRITRDAEFEFDDEGGDLRDILEGELLKRRRNEPVRLEVDSGCSDELASTLLAATGLSDGDLYRIPGPVDIRPVLTLANLPGLDSLRDHPFTPASLPAQMGEDDLWAVLRDRDVLLHHPYDSFDPVVRLVHEAATDERTMAIKLTLYRTSGDSPIIAALAEAAARGKQVTVLVELMARFDEERNIQWSHELESAGAHVIYGLRGLKTHSKMLLIVRREEDGIRRYVHMSTGNYNDSTARLYTDIGLMTTREDIAIDSSGFFNTITGFSDPPTFRRLSMAPLGLRRKFEQLIEREIRHAGEGRPAGIGAKMNSLTDPSIIRLLYRASQAGVPIGLNVRGICCLRPGMPGVSERIHVISVVDRFLEHSRIFRFENGGEREIYLASADWMPRNLDKRVELMFPVLDPELADRVSSILDCCLRDNVKGREMQADGSWRRRSSGPEGEVFRCQEHLIRESATRQQEAELIVLSDFQPRKPRPQSTRPSVVR